MHKEWCNRMLTDLLCFWWMLPFKIKGRAHGCITFKGHTARNRSRFRFYTKWGELRLNSTFCWLHWATNTNTYKSFSKSTKWIFWRSQSPSTYISTVQSNSRTTQCQTFTDFSGRIVSSLQVSLKVYSHFSPWCVEKTPGKRIRSFLQSWFLCSFDPTMPSHPLLHFRVQL